MQHQASPSEQWVKNAVLYQIFLRNFSSEGDFRAATARLDDLAKLGVDVLWLMPLHPIGRKMRKGALGCPYAVQHYEEICPSLGSPGDFQAFVRAAHERGMKVIVDWVANHTSWDSHLIQTQPHFFKRGRKSKQQPGQAGGEEKEVTIDDVRQKIQREMIDDEEEQQAVVQREVGNDEEEVEEEVILPPMEAWWDVAALDYGQPDSEDEAHGFHIPPPLPSTVPRKKTKKKTEAQRALGDYMAGVMKDWVRSFDIDGFRCDVSEMVPAFFWRRAVREIKAQVKPSLMMLSEGALPEHHVGGAFDLTYAWNVYDALTAVIRGAQPASHLHRILKAEAKVDK
jgi:glycosidase